LYMLSCAAWNCSEDIINYVRETLAKARTA
jgi:hypothetical protein